MSTESGSHTKAGTPWRSRIIGSGEEAPDQLLANPLNWRTHPMRQRMMMRGAMREIGWVQQVIVNQRTGHVVDGHLRIEEAISANEPKIPVLYVDLSEEEEKVVLATLDPLGALAGTSTERLEDLLDGLTVTDDALGRLLASMAKRHDERYTDSTAVMRYVPSGEPVDLSALRDETKADQLRAAIVADEEIDEPTRAFLLAAAARHTVFEYAKIADFYAQAPANVQRLMEASALVIIDVDEAIAQGYVRFVEAIEALGGLEDGADGEGDDA